MYVRMYIRVIATGHGPGNPVFTILFFTVSRNVQITYVPLFLAACSVLTKIHAYTMTYVQLGILVRSCEVLLSTNVNASSKYCIRIYTQLLN